MEVQNIFYKQRQHGDILVVSSYNKALGAPSIKKRSLD
jgi:hypothetical protein